MLYRFARWLYHHVPEDDYGIRHVGPLFVEQITGKTDVSYLLLIGQQAMTIWADAIMLSQYKGGDK